MVFEIKTKSMAEKSQRDSLSSINERFASYVPNPKVAWERGVISSSTTNVGGGSTGESSGLTVPLIYGIHDYGEIGADDISTNLEIDLGNNINPHIHKFIVKGAVGLSFINKPSTDKAIFFVIQITQDVVGKHSVTTAESKTDFDVDDTANGTTILSGMVLAGNVYVTNYGSRITTVIQGGSDSGDASKWAEHNAIYSIKANGNQINNLGGINFSQFNGITSKITPYSTHLEYRAGQGRSHQFKSDDNIILAEISGSSINAYSKKIINVNNPISAQDATTLSWVNNKITTEANRVNRRLRAKANLVHGHRIGDVANLQNTLDNKITKGELSITDLSQYTAASRGNAAYLSVPLGMEIRNLGFLKFNTALESAIGGFQSIRVRIIDEGNPSNYKTDIEQVMNIHVNGEKAMAISSLSRTGISTPYNSVAEIFGKRKPLLKLVDTNFYKVPNRVGEIDIGSIYFDAQAPNTTTNNLDFDQTTFAEIKAIAETKRVTDFPAWNVFQFYSRGERVSYSGNVYVYIRSRIGKAVVPGSTQAQNIWRRISTTSLHHGKLNFVLRNINTTLGSSDDEFNTILSLDLDSGIHINSHLTTNIDSQVILSGHVGLGNPGKLVALNTDLRMFANNIFDIASLRLSNRSDPTNNGEIILNGRDVKVYSGGQVRNLSNIGNAGSGFNPASISVPLLPAHTGGEDTDERLGSLSKPWNRVYGKAVYTSKLYPIRNFTGIKIGTTVTKLGFFGKNPISKPTITFTADDTFAGVNTNLMELRNLIINLGLAN